jgi:integrase
MEVFMPKVKLTKKWIDQVPLSPDAVWWDTDIKGLGLRITPTKKAFIIQSRVGGKTRKVTLGKYGHLTLSQAKDMARKELGKMAEGIDPSAQRKKQKAEDVTLEQIVKSYLAAKTLKPLSIKDINTHMNFNFEEWKRKPLSQVTRDNVKRKFLKVSKRSPAQANQAFRVFRALWNYAIAEYRYPNDKPVFGENPVNILSEQQIWNTIKPRDSKIPVNKVGKAWNVIQDLKNSPILTPAGRTLIDATAFIFLTGCRLDEAVSLTWNRININEEWWYLDDSKNSRAVTFPLSKVACQIIDNRPRMNKYVFGSKGKYGHITEIRTPIKKISDALGIKVSAHDLRRTFKAMAIENKIELWKANLLTNHQESGVAIKHYVETSDLQYFKAEVNIIAKWIVEQAKIEQAENVIRMPQKEVS